MNRRNLLKYLATIGAVSAIPGRVLSNETDALPQNETSNPKQPQPLEKNSVQFWLESSLRRVYPNSSPGGQCSLECAAGRNHAISFQVCFRNLKSQSIQMHCETTGAQGLNVRVRRVGFVPLRNFNTYVPVDELEGRGNIPGLCPDPLFPEDNAHVGPLGTGVFWVSVVVPEAAAPGPRTFQVRLTLLNEYSYVGFDNPTPWSVELPVTINIYPLILQKRKGFSATEWISADSIWEWYKIQPFSDRFWQLAEAYIANVVSHGVDVVYSPIFNIRSEPLARPAQLLRVKRKSPDVYEFDFTDVRRWVRIALKHGAAWIEWSHFFTPAPESAAHPQRIVERGENFGSRLFPESMEATSDTYRTFLIQFLSAFKAFLEEEKILDRSLFHCADEPDGAKAIADYRKARGMLKELAPWIKVMDAMSDVHFATERLSDISVPSISTAHEFTKAGCPAWAYFCCGPRDRYLQRLLDTPLAKLRMAGWLFYKLGAKGFLHWGHNYWFQFCTDKMADPFLDASNGSWPGLPYGDPFIVYPGPDGPLDSIRWEIFHESLQDYAILQSAGISVDDPILSEIKGYADFPKSPEWLTKTIQAVLKRSAK